MKGGKNGWVWNLEVRGEEKMDLWFSGLWTRDTTLSFLGLFALGWESDRNYQFANLPFSEITMLGIFLITRKKKDWDILDFRIIFKKLYYCAFRQKENCVDII